MHSFSYSVDSGIHNSGISLWLVAPCRSRDAREHLGTRTPPSRLLLLLLLLLL